MVELFFICIFVLSERNKPYDQIKNFMEYQTYSDIGIAFLSNLGEGNSIHYLEDIDTPIIIWHKDRWNSTKTSRQLTTMIKFLDGHEFASLGQDNIFKYECKNIIEVKIVETILGFNVFNFAGVNLIDPDIYLNRLLAQTEK